MGKGGGGGGGTTNTIAEPWGDAKPLLRDLLGATETAWQEGQFDISPYGGTRVAELGPLTQESFNQYLGLGTSPDPFLGGVQANYDRWLSGDVTADLDALKQNVLSDVMPAAFAPFENAGMLDSTMAADTAARAAASALAPIEYGAWENAQNRALQAAGMAPEMSSARFIAPGMMMAAGQSQDAYNQQLANAAMDTYYEGANQPYDELQRAASLAMGFGGLGGKTKSTSAEAGGGAGSTIGQIAGGVLQLAPFLMMMSDRRAKTDIEQIGTTREGYAKYRYRYIWDDPDVRREGVMADEVPAHLVLEGLGGLKMVNYAGVTL